MKKYFCLILITLVFLGNLNAKKTIVQSSYQHSPIVIDGKMNDWGSEIIFDEKTSIVSNISNDHDYLYIKIRIANFYSISLIKRGGFTVWINDEGKSKPKIGIAFPIVEDMPEQDNKKNTQYASLSRSQMEQLMEKSIEEFNMKFTTGLATVNVIDKDLNILQTKYCNSEEGLSATLVLKDADLFIYEARIPLDVIFENKNEYLASKKKSFCLGYEFGKFEIPELAEKPGSSIPSSQQNRNQGYNFRAPQTRSFADRSKFPSTYTWYKSVYLSSE